jgi:hypothetical protein
MTAVVSECRRCAIAYQSLRPSPEATLAYMNWRWASQDEYVANIDSQLTRARLQLSFVRQYVQSGSLLDFGAGSGAFVRVARDGGFDAEGVERSDTAVANAQSL